MLEDAARFVQLADRKQGLDMVRFTSVLEVVDPIDGASLDAHLRPRPIGRLVAAGTELDRALRGVADHPPDPIQPLDSEQRGQRCPSPFDPAPMGIDHRPIRERRR